MVMLNLVPMLAISLGVLLPAIFYFPKLSTGLVIPTWFLFFTAWVGAMIPLVGITFFQARKWPIIDEVTNWDRVNELLDDEIKVQ